jgi:hypothetical protein
MGLIKAVLFVFFAVTVSAIATISTQRFPNSDFPIGQCNPDPWMFPPGPLKLSANPFLNISEGSTHSVAVSIGLHELDIKFQISMVQSLQPLITFKVRLPEVNLVSSRYDASGEMDFRPLRHSTFPSGKFRGKGPFVASIQNLYIEGSLKLYLFLMSRVKFDWIKVDTLSFSRVSLNFGSFEVDEATGAGFEKIDWKIWNQHFKSNFNSDWEDMSVRNATLGKIIEAMNQKWMGIVFAELYSFLQDPCPGIPDLNE